MVERFCFCMFDCRTLSCAIKCDLYIKVVNIPFSDKTALKFQHTGDTTIAIWDRHLKCLIFKSFDLFERASGAKVNVQKYKLCISSGRHLEDKKQIIV